LAKKFPPGVVPLDSSWLTGLGPSPRPPSKDLGVSRVLDQQAAGLSNPRLTLTERGPSPRSPVPEAGRCSRELGWLAETFRPVQICKVEGVPCDFAAEQTKAPVSPAPASVLKAEEIPPPTSSLPEALLGWLAKTFPPSEQDEHPWSPVCEGGHLVPLRWLLEASLGINDFRPLSRDDPASASGRRADLPRMSSACRSARNLETNARSPRASRSGTAASRMSLLPLRSRGPRARSPLESWSKTVVC